MFQKFVNNMYNFNNKNDVQDHHIADFIFSRSLCMHRKSKDVYTAIVKTEKEPMFIQTGFRMREIL